MEYKIALSLALPRHYVNVFCQRAIGYSKRTQRSNQTTYLCSAFVGSVFVNEAC
jgi:hypothetical protein